jgi:FKBP-type peptidyl-prolyl cis-trans isomerase
MSHVPAPLTFGRPAFSGGATIFAVLATLALGISGTPLANAQTTAPPASAQGASKLDATPKVLQKIDVKQGAGAEATNGKVVVVQYTGWLYDPAKPDNKGAKFDSSRDRSEPFDFPRRRTCHQGWDQGVAGMKVGGQRTLIIPPDMGYGQRGAGGVIPPMQRSFSTSN